MSELSPYLIQRTRPTGSLSRTPRRGDPGAAEGIGIDEIWRVIRRRIRITGSLVIVTLVITAAILYSMTPNYTAETELLIEPDAPQVLNMTQLLEDNGGSPDYDYYKTQFELLKSRALAARVIRELNLSQNEIFNPKPPPPGSFADLVGRVRALLKPADKAASGADAASLEYSVDPGVIDTYISALKIEPIFATRLVTVSFSVPDPVLAARVVNTHVKDFVKRELEIRSGAQRVAEEFLKSQLADIGKRTEQSEAALNAYRQRNGVLSFDVNDSNRVAAQRMSELTRAMTEAETRRITAQAQVELVDHGDFDSLPQVVKNPTISALKPQLVTLQAEYARLSAAFNPTYPKLVELKAQLDQDRAEISAQIKIIASSIRREYRAALTQEDQLRSEVQAEKQRDLALNDALLKDAVLSREVQTNRDLYKNVLQRMEEMSVAAQTPLSNISAVSQAAVPRHPSSPKKKIDLAISALASIMLGLVLSFVMEQVDVRLRTPEEIEHYLDLPTLALVPRFIEIEGPAARRGAQRKIRNGAAPPVPSSLSTLDTYAAGASEVYRTIRTNILFSRAGSSPKTVLFTSAVDGEGKTWNALHTAAAFAQTGAPTLLVSADLRRPRCDKLLNCEGSVGLSDTLVGHRDPHEVIRRVNGQAFFFLSSGSRVPNPAELLVSVRMRQIMDMLATRYPFVLFDSAPLMYASETLAIATMVDGVVMVVGARTPKKTVRAACDRLEMVDAKILGVILNGVDISKPDYKQYTHYYYRYDDHTDRGTDLVNTSPL